MGNDLLMITLILLHFGLPHPSIHPKQKGFNLLPSPPSPNTSAPKTDHHPPNRRSPTHPQPTHKPRFLAPKYNSASPASPALDCASPAGRQGLGGLVPRGSEGLGSPQGPRRRGVESIGEAERFVSEQRGEQSRSRRRVGVGHGERGVGNGRRGRF